MSAENLVSFHWPADAYVVLSYAAVSNYSHDAGERALEGTRSFTGPQVSMRCYLKRQYHFTLIVSLREHFQKRSPSPAHQSLCDATLCGSIELLSCRRESTSTNTLFRWQTDTQCGATLHGSTGTLPQCRRETSVVSVLLGHVLTSKLNLNLTEQDIPPRLV